MQKLFSVIIVFLLGVFLSSSLLKPLPAFDQDLGRHFLLGKFILTTFSVPQTNMLSYTHSDFPFINHHWLSEVVYYLLFSTLGSHSLFILLLFLILGSFSFLIWYLYKKEVSPLAIGLYGVCSVGIIFPRVDIRPELFGWFFLSVVLVLLYRYRDNFHKGIFLLPVLFFFWIQFHISFVLGLFVFFLFVIDYLFLHKKDFKQKSVRVLVGAFGVSGLLSFLNPNGIKGALYPLSIFQNYGYTIQENMSIFFMQQRVFTNDYLILYVCTLILFFSLFLNFKKTKPIDWLLSLSFTILAFSAVRNLPNFVIVSFIPATVYLSSSLESLRKIFSLSEKNFLIGGGVLLLFFTFWQGHTIYKTSLLQLEIQESGKDALTFFHEKKLKGPIFNNFDIGSYIAYRLYPTEQVFVDGRPEAYPASFFQETYIPMQEKEEVFNRVDSQYRFNTIVFSHTDQTPWAEAFLSRIVKSTEWKIIYLDSAMIVLVKNIPENEPLITQFAKPLEKIQVSGEVNSYRKHLQLARFFQVTNHPERVKEYVEKIVEKYPPACNELGILIQLYQQENNPLTSVYLQKYQQNCL